MDHTIVGAVCLLLISGIIVSIWGGAVSARREKEKRKAQKKREREQAAIEWLRFMMRAKFDVDMDQLHDSATQNEIVRIVNLLALETAMMCVEQGKAIRDHAKFSGGSTLSGLKRDWAEARNTAIQALPELADRMPHFSEFEPLKSYNEEHLRKKAERRTR